MNNDVFVCKICGDFVINADDTVEMCRCSNICVSEQRMAGLSCNRPRIKGPASHAAIATCIIVQELFEILNCTTPIKHPVNTRNEQFPLTEFHIRFHVRTYVH